jgi:hypothetical protein
VARPLEPAGNVQHLPDPRNARARRVTVTTRGHELVEPSLPSSTTSSMSERLTWARPQRGQLESRGDNGICVIEVEQRQLFDSDVGPVPGGGQRRGCVRLFTMTRSLGTAALRSCFAAAL